VAERRWRVAERRRRVAERRKDEAPVDFGSPFAGKCGPSLEKAVAARSPGGHRAPAARPLHQRTAAVAYPLSFDQPGAPTYFLDDDTGWDPGGPDQNDHAQPGLLQCGGEMRSIFCCYPLCIPPGG
jgi:hypothetical protein